MNDDFLKRRLRRVGRRYQWVGFWRTLAACWAVAALVGAAIVWWQRATGHSWPLALPLLAATAAGAATALGLRHFLREPDPRWLARRIEKKFPELDGVLLTAVQQTSEGGRPAGYLQYRVIQEATARSQQQDWRAVVPTARLAGGAFVHLVALGCFVYALGALKVERVLGEATVWTGADGVAVTPGDAQIEKGESLVVLARFGGTLPPNVGLVVRESGAAPRTIPLVKSLADPVFGGSVPEVAADLTYHLEYRGEKTREFKVTVFEHPKLVRSDVELTFPAYTSLPEKRIEDTRRVSAVEGTRMTFTLQLNKPVKSAQLVSRDKDRTTIDLAVTAGKPVATLAGYVPAKSGSYDLKLVDAEGRPNKTAAPFTIDVQPNRPPEIRLAAPRGDVRPSALEEVAFDGTVWDDFGSPEYGLAYAIAGGETKFVSLGRDAKAKEKRSFAHLIDLEKLQAKPDDLISWYAWADDIGPDGKVRRTSGDLYFAEVRPFDEIFRESQNMESGEEGGGGGGGQQGRRLTELQKQIINATWKLQREGRTPKYAEDAKIVAESQGQALEQAAELAAEARGPREQAMWRAVTQEMETAVEKLKAAATDPAALAQALPPEQAAYQALLKLQARETSVTRRQRQQGGGGGGQQANQRQIDELDLQQSEKRYETQRLAKSPQNPERREQLAVMNRLQELARRQQDLNERLKELQTQLQEAKSEQEKEEIKRRLKRLQEEQQQMLSDVDELRQRMDRPENQSRMAEERQQLEQTRDDIQKASEAAADGSVSQALASGTRAQRQLQQLRDDMRKENASQFSEQMKEMRQEARELSRQQEQLGQKLEQLANSGQQQRRSLSDSGDQKEIIDQLAEQKDKLNRLVEQATQVSEQAENTEPLLSRQLYDSIRKLSQDDANAVKEARQELLTSGQMTRDLYDRLQRLGEREGGGKALDVTSELLREGRLPQARQAGQNVRNEIEELRRGVERAAESVLGDDAEQLRLAQSELDALTEQLTKELAQAGGGASRDPAGERAGQRPGEGDRRQAGTQPGRDGERGAGERDETGERRPDQQPGREGEPAGQEGRQPGQRGDAERMAESGRQPGQQPGQGQGQGQEGQPGERPDERMAGQQPGGRQPGERQPGQGQQGQGQGQGQGSEAEGQGQGGGAGGENRERIAGGGDQRRNQPGSGRRQISIEDLMRRNSEGGADSGGAGAGPAWGGEFGGYTGGNRWGPLTSEDFTRWNERLRDVEELLEEPDLRNAVAAARERARQIRREVRELKKPDWTVVKLQILQPLVEVRSRVAEELARRGNKDSLAPIDRDPVPNRFAETVRRYYEELGKDVSKP